MAVVVGLELDRSRLFNTAARLAYRKCLNFQDFSLGLFFNLQLAIYKDFYGVYTQLFLRAKSVMVAIQQNNPE